MSATQLKKKTWNAKKQEHMTHNKEKNHLTEIEKHLKNNG